MQDKNQLPNRLIVLNRKLIKIIEELNDIAHLTGNEHAIRYIVLPLQLIVGLNSWTSRKYSLPQWIENFYTTQRN